LSKFWKDKTVISNTQQLFWDYSEKGFFTINSSGTKGLVGFAKDKKFDLGEISLRTDNEFAVILVSSMEKDQGTNNAKRLLVTTIARAKNTGMEYDTERKNLLKVGETPILVEAVKVNLTIKRKEKFTVYLLDHLGNRTNEMVKPSEKKIILDGKKSKAIYYEIVFE
jgi:hypothetical protein